MSEIVVGFFGNWFLLVLLECVEFVVECFWVMFMVINWYGLVGFFVVVCDIDLCV